MKLRQNTINVRLINQWEPEEGEETPSQECLESHWTWPQATCCCTGVGSGLCWRHPLVPPILGSARCLLGALQRGMAPGLGRREGELLQHGCLYCRWSI